MALVKYLNFTVRHTQLLINKTLQPVKVSKRHPPCLELTPEASLEERIGGGKRGWKNDDMKLDMLSEVTLT
jgi:hypothetical protein